MPRVCTTIGTGAALGRRGRQGEIRSCGHARMRHHHASRGVVALVTFAAASGCLRESPPTPSDRTIMQFTAALDTVIPSLLARHRVPGAAVVLLHRGAVAWAGGFGVADSASEQPVTTETVFNVGSVSKSVAAWGVMSLAEDGRLDLDHPIGTYLSRWSLPSSAFDATDVTARRLLSHTAGLSVHGYLGQVVGDRLLTLEESLSGRDTIVDMFRPDSLYDGTGGVRIILPPGKTWRYSGGGYTLLQLAVEEVAQGRFADFMSRIVFAPLGMHRTSYDWPARLRHHTAAPYSGGVRVPHRLFTAQAAAGLHTTASDLARLVGALIGREDRPAGGGVVTPGSVQQMITMQPNTNPNRWRNAGWGLGFALDTLPDGTRVVSHGGDNVGWAGRWMLVPDQGSAIVILTNSETGSGLIDDVLCRWLRWAVDQPPAICVEE